MANYLDTTGLKSLWEKIKSLVSGVSDNVTTIKNDYISKVWFNYYSTMDNAYKSKFTHFLSPKTQAGGNNGVSDAEVGIFAIEPLIVGAKLGTETSSGDSHAVNQGIVLKMLQATSTQDGYMSKKDKATIDGLGELASKDSIAFEDITDKPTTLAGYGITDGVNNITEAQSAINGNAVTNISLLGHTLTFTKGSFLTTTAASSTYLTKTDASSTYLPLAGGTLTGELKTTSNISANKGFILQVDGLNALTLNSSGNLAIGYGYRSTSATSLQGKTVELKSGDTTILNVSSTGVAVTGKVTATGTISGNSSSDERKKENIVEADSLAELSTLGGVYDFNYKETGEHSTGFIAQKVQDGIFADIVTEDADGYKQINYWSPKLIAAAIGAIGQLEARVKELEAKVKETDNN